MDNHTAKINEILRGIDEEIDQREKDPANADHKAFEAGYRAGLARVMTTIQIFFHNDLKKEV